MEQFCWPNVVAIEGDVLPSERGDMGKQGIADDLPQRPQLINGAPEIDGVQRMTAATARLRPEARYR